MNKKEISEIKKQFTPNNRPKSDGGPRPAGARRIHDRFAYLSHSFLCRRMMHSNILPFLRKLCPALWDEIL